MQARHVILIIVIIILVVIVWYNRNKLKNKYKVEGSKRITVNKTLNGLLSIYIWKNNYNIQQYKRVHNTIYNTYIDLPPTSDDLRSYMNPPYVIEDITIDNNPYYIKIGALSGDRIDVFNEIKSHGKSYVLLRNTKTSVNIRNYDSKNETLKINDKETSFSQISFKNNKNEYIASDYLTYNANSFTISLLEGFLHIYLIITALRNNKIIYAFSEKNPNNGFIIRPGEIINYFYFLYNNENYSIKTINGQDLIDNSDETIQLFDNLFYEINTYNIMNQLINDYTVYTSKFEILKDKTDKDNYKTWLIKEGFNYYNINNDTKKYLYIDFDFVKTKITDYSIISALISTLKCFNALFKSNQNINTLEYYGFINVPNTIHGYNMAPNNTLNFDLYSYKPSNLDDFDIIEQNTIYAWCYISKTIIDGLNENFDNFKTLARTCYSDSDLLIDVMKRLCNYIMNVNFNETSDQIYSSITNLVVLFKQSFIDIKTSDKKTQMLYLKRFLTKYNNNSANINDVLSYIINLTNQPDLLHKRISNFISISFGSQNYKPINITPTNRLLQSIIND